jgi:hypothetical protein
MVLYKTSTPQRSHLDGEFYDLSVQKAPDGYLFKELHGWWDEKGQRVIDPGSSFEYVYPTLAEAEARLHQQRSHRVENGFTHSFSTDYFASEPDGYVYEYLGEDEEALT